MRAFARLAPIQTDFLAHRREQLNGNPQKGIPGRRPELDRIEQHLRSYHETFDKYSTEEARLQAEIADLEELRRDKRTRADLVRLKADFEALQHVQGWYLVQFAQDRVVMRHFDEFVVDLALRPGSLAVERASLQLALPKKMAGSLGGQITAFLLAKLGEEVENILSQDTARDARVSGLIRRPIRSKGPDPALTLAEHPALRRLARLHPPPHPP